MSTSDFNELLDELSELIEYIGMENFCNIPNNKNNKRIENKIIEEMCEILEELTEELNDIVDKLIHNNIFEKILPSDLFDCLNMVDDIYVKRTKSKINDVSIIMRQIKKCLTNYVKKYINYKINLIKI